MGSRSSHYTLTLLLFSYIRNTRLLQSNNELERYKRLSSAEMTVYTLVLLAQAKCQKAAFEFLLDFFFSHTISIYYFYINDRKYNLINLSI